MSKTILIITLVLTVLGVGVYIKDQKWNKSSLQTYTSNNPNKIPDSTSAWKTYDSDKFTVQYPSDWQRENILDHLGRGLPVGIRIFYPQSYELGGPHVSEATKNYRHQLILEPVTGRDESNRDANGDKKVPTMSAKQEMDLTIATNYQVKHNNASYFRDSFDRNGAHFEVYGLLPFTMIEGDGTKTSVQPDADPRSGFFLANLYISNGQTFLDGSISLHDSSTNSTEYKILTSIKLK